MESLTEIDLVNGSPSELLAYPLNITLQQNVNEDNSSSTYSQNQEPMETIPVEQIDQINAKSQKRKNPDITSDKPFMESGACPPFIKPLKQDEDRDCDLIPILSSRQFTFRSHLTSLYMIPTKYKFIIREFKNDYHTSSPSKLITPYDWWLNNKVEIFSFQYNFLRPSSYDLRTEENDANFLPYQIKKAHHVTYQKFFQYKEPENYLFFNSKYTSLFTFNTEDLIDHTKIKGKLRNYDPLKQSFLFLPNENPKRPIILPQEFLILNDDSLLQEDIPQGISDPLPPIQPTISAFTKGNVKEHKNTNRKSSKKSTIAFLNHKNFPPTEEVQKYKQLMENLKPYHNTKKDIVITIADNVNTLEQTRDLMQNIAFDTTRVSQSASCIRTSLDEINYTVEKLQQS